MVEVWLRFLHKVEALQPLWTLYLINWILISLQSDCSEYRTDYGSTTTPRFDRKRIGDVTNKKDTIALSSETILLDYESNKIMVSIFLPVVGLESVACFFFHHQQPQQLQLPSSLHFVNPFDSLHTLISDVTVKS